MSRSEIRVFRKNGFTAKGNILPRDKVKLFIDMENPTVAPERGDYVVSKSKEEYENIELKLIPLSLYRDKFLTGVRSRFEAQYNERRNTAFYLTLAEIYEKQGKYIDKIADAVWAMLEETSWCLPAHQYTSRTHSEYELPEAQDSESLAGLDLQTSQTCATLAVVRHLLGAQLDKISPSICKRIDKLVYLRGVRPFIAGTYWWAGDYAKTVCNWCTNITSNILFAGALTVEDMEVREMLLNKAMYNLDNFTASYPEDGCCAEGPAYWGAAPGNLFDALEIIEDITGGKISVYHEEIIKNMGNYVVDLNVDGDWYACFADCGSKLHHSGDVLARYGRKCNSPALEAFGLNNALGAEKCYYFYGMAYRILKNYFTPVVKEAVKPKARTAVWLDGHKIAVFRECEDTSKGLFLCTKGGNNSEPGNHNDLGCLVIHSNGKPVIVDPSIGSYDNEYFGKLRYERWYTNASYHSAPTFDGIDQESARNGDPHASKNEVCDIENKTVSMDISEAYPKEAGVISFVRTSHLEAGRITVTDEVVLDKERRMEFHLTSHAEPKPLGEGRVELADGRVLSYNPELELKIEKIENTKPFEDLHFKSKWDVECLWRICLGIDAKEYTASLVIE